ncbi:MAG: IMP cyclohydrolase [Deltaproteobacteria bacterium]|nr:IMP cyclohydrolase [Deltaproteobacteria bacterium]
MTETFPDKLTIELGDALLVYAKTLFKLPSEQGGQIESGLRYGENPDQPAAVYRLVNGHLAVSGAQYVGPESALVSGLGLSGSQIYGSRKHPSKTNLTDVDSALGILRYLSIKPAAVIIKHNNPSGAAWGESLEKAFSDAFEADRVAAFGGAVAVNRPVTAQCAQLMGQRYLEVVAAPDFEPGALDILLKKPDLRIFKIPRLDKLSDYQALRYLDFKSLIDGGLVIQRSACSRVLSPSDFVTARAEKDGQVIESLRQPTEEEAWDLLFGWAVEQGVISNSVIFVKNGVTAGIGCGQQDRVGVVEIAAFKARRNLAESIAQRLFGESFSELQAQAASGAKPQRALASVMEEVEANQGGLAGSRLVSDAFFPFRDAVDKAIAQKVTAIAHPGGSLRDYESLLAANQADPPVAMVFTGQRAFKH